jgi:isoaspartyl peptidase/L-asparaginase-like protein (Ntn-hydrolase superfamily)
MWVGPYFLEWMFLVAHTGGGRYPSDPRGVARYRKAIEVALGEGSQQSNPQDACVACVCALEVARTAWERLTPEDAPITNAGYGSALNFEGDVECDASIMSGSDGQSGAVGCIQGPPPAACANTPQGWPTPSASPKNSSAGAVVG